jgi:hypothetical protein
MDTGGLTGAAGSPGRGVVVSVWRDPETGTTKDTLARLERGFYGPFFASA